MRALVTGITGQDAHYLTRLLLSKGYTVYGLIRGQSNPRRADVHPDAILLDGDLCDGNSLIRALNIALPDETYNLGAISHVGHSFTQPDLTANVTGLGALRLLEAVRMVCPETRYYQASSSEQFGSVHATPQTETTPFHPRSPYGCAKVLAHHTTVNYREAYGLHASCGILFNHESPHRGPEFVTRKITLGLARVAAGHQPSITLGNLDAHRDWGYADDYVTAMWRMLQQPEPDDYVIATGISHTVRNVVELALGYYGLGWDTVELSPLQHRPAEVDTLRGDASKARTELGWEPTVGFVDLIHMMCEHDRWAVKRQEALVG